MNARGREVKQPPMAVAFRGPKSVAQVYRLLVPPLQVYGLNVGGKTSCFV